MVQHTRFEAIMAAEKAAAQAEDLNSEDDESTSGAIASSWEAEVLRRIAPRLEEARRRAARGEEELGWEAACVRRLVAMTGREA